MFRHAVVDLAQPPTAPFDDPVPQRGCPRVDPEDLHPATSAKTSSGMSKLAVTRCTSSRSSSSSTRRSAWRAFDESSSTVCLATIADSADSIWTPADSSAWIDRLELARRGVDVDGLVAVGVDVLGSGIDGGQGDLVGVGAGPRDGDQAARLELPRDRARSGQLAAGLREHRADLGRGPVAVVGLGLDEDRHAARAVALVDDLLELLGLAAAGRLVDRPLDVVGRHVDRARLLDGEPQPVVGVRVAAALPGSHGDLPGDLGEQCSALGVGDALGAFDRGPF